jgi:5-methylcytosine-specific restriction endonuclease McrA
LIDKSGYCPKHQASKPKRHTLYNRHVRNADPASALAYKIRKSRKWLKVRAQVLADNPICADPFGDHARAGITRTATQVHHLEGIVEHPELWNVQTNLQALCTACHAKVERGVRRDAASDPETSSRKAGGNQPPPGEVQNFCPFG